MKDGATLSSYSNYGVQTRLVGYNYIEKKGGYFICEIKNCENVMLILEPKKSDLIFSLARLNSKGEECGLKVAEAGIRLSIYT